MKKKITLLIISILIVTLHAPAVYAQSISSESSSILYEEMTSRKVQYIWKYRVYNGKVQKRLWNESDQKWVNQWQDV